MAYQLIYTSVSRGLIPGRSGYTVAARHRQIRDRLVSDIERISGYTFATSGVSPVIYAHRRISCSGKEYHVLTRNKDAGSDYTGRTNHLAQHLVCEAEEIAACGASPAEILHGFHWMESYAEEPRYLEDNEVIDLGQFAGTFKLPAKNWQAVRGEAGDAALLIDDAGKPGSAFVVTSSGADDDARKLLAMYAESLHLATSVDDTPAMWKASFTTYLQQVDTLADFDWAGCTGGQPLLQRPGNRLVLDLAALDVLTPASKQAKLAVTGRVDLPPPTHRSAASLPTPDALKQDLPVSQSGLGARGQQPDQSRRVTFTPVDSQPDVKSRVPAKLRGSGPIPVPSVSMQSPGSGKLDFLKQPENLRFVIGGGVAAVLLLGLFCYYLFSVHPRQDFQADVRGQIANLYWQGAMDAIDKEKENMDAELVEELRREVMVAMIARVEGINEKYAAKKGEGVKQLEQEISGKLDQLVEFEKKYDLANQDIEDLVASFKGIKKTKRNAEALGPESPGLTSSGKGTPPPDVTDPEENGAGEEVLAGNEKSPPSGGPVVKEPAEEVLPNAVYLFLNDQSVELDKVQYNESWANLQTGKEGARKVALRHYSLSSGNLLLLDPSSGDPYHYKFPESAEEESSDGYFPIEGNLNIKVMFKGSKTALLKRATTGKDVKDAWDRAQSNLFAFEGQGNRFQVLLWNGIPFKVTRVKPFTMSGKVVSVTAGFARYLASFKAGNSFEAKAEPTEVFMRYVSGRSSAGEELFFESERLQLPIEDARRGLRLNFSANGEKSRDDVAGLERKVSEARQSIANYENYRRWFAYREYLKKDLGQMGRDYITRFKEKDYPQICDPGNFSKEDDVREQILDFAEDMVDGLPDALEDQDVGDSDVKRVTFSLRAEKFSELSFATPVAGFKMGMEAFAESCRDLAKSSYRDDDGDRVYRIRDRDAREAIEEFATRWEDFFGGEKGERLWHFVAAKPKLPKMTEKEYSLMKRRLVNLTRSKAAADQASKRFDFLDTSGMPPGIYEIVFVFGDDKQMPFIIWNKEGKRGK